MTKPYTIYLNKEDFLSYIRSEKFELYKHCCCNDHECYFNANEVIFARSYENCYRVVIKYTINEVIDALEEMNNEYFVLGVYNYTNRHLETVQESIVINSFLLQDVIDTIHKKFCICYNTVYRIFSHEDYDDFLNINAYFALCNSNYAIFYNKRNVLCTTMFTNKMNGKPYFFAVFFSHEEFIQKCKSSYYSDKYRSNVLHHCTIPEHFKQYEYTDYSVILIEPKDFPYIYEKLSKKSR